MFFLYSKLRQQITLNNPGTRQLGTKTPELLLTFEINQNLVTNALDHHGSFCVIFVFVCRFDVRGISDL